jgi:hypothetical protein
VILARVDEGAPAATIEPDTAVIEEAGRVAATVRVSELA